jgi:RNA polymerase sigma-70 factor (ECF subfamily)
MSPSRHEQETTPAGVARFATTHWSVVLAAGRKSSPRAQEALAALCQTYWYPLYACVRRQGHPPHAAQDLTQEFFARLLEKNFLGDVRRARGRFRSFLLAALKHFLANEWDRERALKRGGGREFISLEAEAEARYALEPVDLDSPDRLYERRWALTLLERVLAALKREWTIAGRAAHFDALKDTLAGGRGSVPYAQLAERLGMSEEAVKVAAHRLRKRYRELLRSEIAQTVARPEEVEDEIRHLFTVLSS